MSQNILITGARAPVAIDLARAFKAAGYTVHMADSVTPWAARWSSAKTKIHRHSPPRFEFDAFAIDLKKLVDTLNPLLIIPTCEEVFYVSAAAQKHGFQDRLFAPPLDVLDKLHSKIRFAAHIKGLGLDAPSTNSVDSLTSFQELNIAPKDCVLKPEYSRFGTATLIQPKSLDKWAPVLGRSWAVQEFIKGEEICLWAACINGKVVASAAYRPVWRYGRSASYAFERVESRAALSVAETIAAADGISGHLSFDIILTPDGRAVPLECNPRATSGLHLFDGQGALAKAIITAKPKNLPIAKLRFLSLAMVLLGPPAALMSGRLKSYLATWKVGQDALGRRGDRLPVAGAMLDAIRFVIMGLSRSNSGAAQTTDDIEWNGEPLL